MKQLLTDSTLLVDIVQYANVAAIVIADPQGQIVFANQATMQLWGQLPTEQLFQVGQRWIAQDRGWQWVDLLGKPLTSEELPLNQVLRSQTALHNVRLSLQLTTGQIYYLLINAAPSFNYQGDLLGAVCVITDVTHQSERALQVLKRLDHQLGLSESHPQPEQLLSLLTLDLVAQLEQKTDQIAQFWEYERLLKRITEQVRDSWDENEILLMVVEELGDGLGLGCCQRVFTTTGTHRIYQAYTPPTSAKADLRLDLAALDQWHVGLPTTDLSQFCAPITSPLSQSVPSLAFAPLTILHCPMQDEQTVFGDLWLWRPYAETFSELEVNLIRQVARQSAIALHQSRLYQTAQTQVVELAKLNRLKDDFLNTISHELRTPLSSIKMSIQLLEILLAKLGIEIEPAEATELTTPNSLHPKIAACLKILRDECDQEIHLVTDLLTLQQLEAGTQPIMLSPIQIGNWVAQVVETFSLTAQKKQQTITLNIPPNLPCIASDLFLLNHVLQELLTNACKFSPLHGHITVTVHLVPDSCVGSQTASASIQSSPSVPKAFPVAPALRSIAPPDADRRGDFPPFQFPTAQTQQQIWSHPQLYVCVTNTGIELPASELPLIFNQFYRVPSADPWKYSGTGLGLTLVQKMIHYLHGTVWAESELGETRLIFRLPVELYRPTDPTGGIHA